MKNLFYNLNHYLIPSPIKGFIPKTFISILFYFLLTSSLYSQQQSTTVSTSSSSLNFNSAVFPWIVINPNKDKHSFYKKELDSSLEKLSNLFQKQQPLETPPEFSSINMKKLLSQIKIGTSISSSHSNIILQPIWIATQDNDFIFLQAFDFNNTLIYSDHIKTQLNYTPSLKNKTTPTDLSSIISFLFNKISPSINSYKNKISSSLKLKLLSSTTTKIPAPLFTLVMEEYLLNSHPYRIIRSSSIQYITILHTLKGSSFKNRVNRAMRTYWTYDNTTTSNSNNSFNFKYNLSESIFSSSLPSDNASLTQVELLEVSTSNPSYKKITLKNIPDTFITQLFQQEKELSNPNLPQVVKISKSWAYLDKGRAQGLKLHDRFVSESDPNIQGHIVSYYGSELNLKSDHGYQISEGAILFIRKGQSKLKIGQKFKKDPTQYPTTLNFK